MMDIMQKYKEIIKQIDSMDEEVHKIKPTLKGLFKRIIKHQTLKPEVQQELVWYYGQLSGRPKTKLKSLQESTYFQEEVNTLMKKTTKKQADEWWAKQKGAFDAKEKEHTSLQKRLVQVRKYARVVYGMRRGRYPIQFDHLEMPMKDEREQKKKETGITFSS